MIGCGLRREEVARLRFEDFRQREGRWVIVDLRGKHGRVRSIPMPGWAKTAIDQWASSAEISTARIPGRQ
jgi:integrase